MANERYTVWTPIEGIPTSLNFQGIHDDYEGTRFLLRGQDPTKPMLRILFDSIVSYRNVNESFRLRTWDIQDGRIAKASLFTVDPSDWLDWLRTEAGGVLDRVQLVHYAIITGDDCIDIAAEFPPVVEWLGE